MNQNIENLQRIENIELRISALKQGRLDQAQINEAMAILIKQHESYAKSIQVLTAVISLIVLALIVMAWTL